MLKLITKIAQWNCFQWLQGSSMPFHSHFLPFAVNSTAIMRKEHHSPYGCFYFYTMDMQIYHLSNHFFCQGSKKRAACFVMLHQLRPLCWGSTRHKAIKPAHSIGAIDRTTWKFSKYQNLEVTSKIKNSSVWN